MWSRLNLKFRTHITTTAIVLVLGGAVYGSYQGAQMIKRWSNMQPHVMHEEMEDFLYAKELRQQQQIAQEKRST
ncbi:hypothetical protein L596_023496 [Steinernema carpocapsae]|uniref:Uncharacterized protein n=1 Tax=Steinernema carpocapsae TaxID=34508 RepID=A0A4V5ZZF2_STECR|nr:hypothetical protein L596_023496 [Steinernema carpocapsae]